jgi:hypothetical protein
MDKSIIAAILSVLNFILKAQGKAAQVFLGTPRFCNTFAILPIAKVLRILGAFGGKTAQALKLRSGMKSSIFLVNIIVETENSPIK